jgi:hypothetical protein
MSNNFIFGIKNAFLALKTRHTSDGAVKNSSLFRDFNLLYTWPGLSPYAASCESSAPRTSS